MDSCPICNEVGHMMGVEYAYGHPEHYDGVSEWHCLKCGRRFGRWSKRILGDNEFEKRWGGRE